MKTYTSTISPRLTLKGIKICQWASEETLCFEANIYFDGKKAGTYINLDEKHDITTFSWLKQGGKKVRNDHPGIPAFVEKNNITVVEAK